jgi:CDP-diacylglycerol--glycerol-3-phosphate 3-phosphatidyltransferase
MDGPGTEFRASDRILTVSNAVSFLRLLLAFPTSIAISNGEKELALALMLMAYFSDLLDGYIARKTNTISEWGKIIDPLADKIFVGIVIIVMFIEGIIPLWFFLVVVSRDVMIFFGGVIVKRQLDFVLPSNWWGKATVLIISITLFLCVLGVSHDILVLGMGVSSALGAISLFVYASRLATLLKNSDVS